MILAHAHSVKHAYLFQGPLMIVLFCKPIILSRFIRPIHVPKPRIPSTEYMNEKGNSCATMFIEQGHTVKLSEILVH